MLVRFFKIFRKGLIIAFLALVVSVIAPAFLPFGFSENNIGMHFGVDMADAADAESTEKPSETSNKLVGLFSWLLVVVIKIVAGMMGMILSFVSFLYSWQNANLPQVAEAWVMMRDFCNGFFIVALLIIAFATILRIESYAMKRAMPKILIMAVLINFSKTITLFLIDISNVVMMTFVTAWGGSDGLTANKFMQLIGMHNLVTWSNKAGALDTFDALGHWEILLALAFMAIFLVVAFIAMASIMTMLLGRVIVLMILTVLSPLAFAAYAIPGMQGSFSRWWSELMKYLTTGPVLAFFTWFSFLVMNGKSNPITSIDPNNNNVGQFQAVATQMGDFKSYSSFFLGIGLLVMAIKVASSSGTIGASMGGKLLSKAEAMGKGALTGVTKWGVKKVPGVQTAIDVKDMAKGYLAQRAGLKEGARKARVEKGVAAISGGLGAVREGLVAKTGIKSAINKLSGKKANDEEEKKIAELRTQNEVNKGKASDLRVKAEERTKAFESGRFKDGTDTFHKDASGQWWQTDSRGTTINVDEAHVASVKDLANKEDADEADELETGMQNRQDEINKKTEELSRARKRQSRKESLIGVGVKLGALGGVAATGGVGWGVAGALAATGGLSGTIDTMAGAPKFAQTLRDAGSDDYKIARNYQAAQVSSAREGLKGESNANIQATLDNGAKDSFTRLAALFEAMEKKIVATEEVRIKMDELKLKVDGTKEGEAWKNKKIGGQFDALAERNYPALTNTFRNLTNTGTTPSDTLNRERAQQVVRERYESGASTLENSNIETLKASISQMVDGLSLQKFLSQFERIDKVKQRELIKELRKLGTADARTRLAHIQGVKSGFTDDDTGNENINERNQFINGLSVEQLGKIIKEGGPNLRELSGAIGGNIGMLGEAVQKAINRNTASGKTIAAAFDIPQPVRP